MPPPPEESGAVVESPARKNAAGFSGGQWGGQWGGKAAAKVKKERAPRLESRKRKAMFQSFLSLSSDSRQSLALDMVAFIVVFVEEKTLDIGAKVKVTGLHTTGLHDLDDHLEMYSIAGTHPSIRSIPMLPLAHKYIAKPIHEDVQQGIFTSFRQKPASARKN